MNVPGSIRRLYLHVGHSKTGSSYLQQSFLLSSDRFAEYAIDYPTDVGPLEYGHATIVSGNAVTALDSAEDLARHLRVATPDRHLLLSSELMFLALHRNEDLSFLPQVAADHGFDEVQVLMFVRDPIEHALSLWQQRVKRSGASLSRDEFFDTYEHPARVLRISRRLAELPRTTLTLRNYSRCQDRIGEVTAAWLGIDDRVLVRPDTATVNRSLTPAEEELQLAFNRELGACGHLIADPLCQQLPDIRGAVRPPSVAAQEAALARLRAPIDEMNTVLGVDDSYECEITPPGPDSELVLTPEQFAVVAASLASHLRVQAGEPVAPSAQAPAPPDSARSAAPLWRRVRSRLDR